MVTKGTVGILDLPFTFAEAYGADGTGATDSATAVSTFLAAARDSTYPGMALGSYLLSSVAAVILEGTAPGDHIFIRGGGQHTRTFVVNNATGGLDFDWSGAGRQQTIQMTDVHFQPGLIDSGQALIASGNPGGISNQNGVILENVLIGPLDEGGTVEGNLDFSAGLDVSGLSRFRAESVRIVRNNLSTHKWPYILNLSNVYGPEIHAFHANIATPLFNGGADIGILWAGGDEEGGELKDVLLNGADIGVKIERTGREPGFQWEGGHINHRHIGFWINGLKFGYISNTLIYSNNVDAEDEGTPDTVDVFIEDCDGFSFNRLQFRTPGKNRRHYWLEPKAGKAGAVVANITIDMTEGTLFASQDGTPPIYCNGALNVVIKVPFHANTIDFASYPRKLVEFGPNQDPSEVKIIFAGGMISMDGGAASGPDFILDRQSPTPADGDRLGVITFRGDNDVEEPTSYARIGASANDVTDGSEDGSVNITLMTGGTLVEQFKVLNPASDGGTSIWALVNKAGVFTLQPLKMGADGTGPGGSGRAAYFD